MNALILIINIGVFAAGTLVHFYDHILIHLLFNGVRHTNSRVSHDCIVDHNETIAMILVYGVTPHRAAATLT